MGRPKLRSFDHIEERVMKRMYVDERLRIGTIARYFNTSHSTIKFYLTRRLGVTLRTITPSGSRYAKLRPQPAKMPTTTTHVAGPDITKELMMTGRPSRRHLIRTIA